MQAYLALAWLFIRIRRNTQRAKTSWTNKAAGILVKIMLSLVSLTVAAGLYPLLIAFAADRKGAADLSTFSFYFFVFLGLFFCLSSLRSPPGLPQAENLSIYPISTEGLLCLSLLVKLTTFPSLYLYPSILAYLAAIFKIAGVSPTTLGLWRIGVSVMCFIGLMAAMGEGMAGCMELLLRKRRIKQVALWLFVGVMVLGLARWGQIGVESLGRFKTPSNPAWLVFPPSALSWSISAEVCHDQGAERSFTTLAIFLFLGIGVYLVDRAVYRRLFFYDERISSRTMARPKKLGIHANVISRLFWRPIIGMTLRELKYFLMSSLGKWCLGLAVVTSLALTVVVEQFGSLIGQFGFLTPSTVQSVSGFVGWSFVNLMLYFFSTNCFGLDRRGLGFLLASPVSGREVLCAKNMAWMIVSEFCWVAALVAGHRGLGNRFTIEPDWGSGAAFQVYLLISLGLGNLVSLYCPLKIDMLSFRGSSGGGSGPAMLTPAVWGIATLSGVLCLLISMVASPGLKSLAIISELCLAGTIYFWALAFAERRLDRTKEILLSVLI